VHRLRDVEALGLVRRVVHFPTLRRQASVRDTQVPFSTSLAYRLIVHPLGRLDLATPGTPAVGTQAVRSRTSYGTCHHRGTSSPQGEGGDLHVCTLRRVTVPPNAVARDDEAFGVDPDDDLAGIATDQDAGFLDLRWLRQHGRDEVQPPVRVPPGCRMQRVRGS
jgi:hypothetical protein